MQFTGISVRNVHPDNFTTDSQTSNYYNSGIFAGRMHAKFDQTNLGQESQSFDNITFHMVLKLNRKTI